MRDSIPILRFFLLIIFLGLILWWVFHHCGIVLQSIVIIGILLSLGKVAWAILGKKDREIFVIKLRKLVIKLTDGRYLTVLGVVTVIFYLWASVVITGQEFDGPLSIRVLSPNNATVIHDEGNIEKTHPEYRGFFLIPLWGRRLHLEVRGHCPLPVRLYPWRGAHVELGKHFKRSPQVLVRIGPTQVSLRSGARIEVWEDSKRIGTANMNADRAAVWIGHKVAIPAEWPERWQEDLRDIWNNPVMIQPANHSGLAVGSPLRVVLLARTGKAVAHREFNVEKGNFIDIVLE